MCFILAMVTYAQAEVMYISDIRQITMRTGQGLDRKIIALLESGQQVEVLEADQDWSRVRISSGKEGWVLSRYLTAKLPDSAVLEKLQEDYDRLKSRASVSEKENSELKAKLETVTGEFSATRQELEQLRNAYQTLEKESSQYLELKSIHEQTALQLSEQSRKAEACEAELSRLKLSRNIKWFLTGAGVLLAGFIIGLSARRRRSKSLL